MKVENKVLRDLVTKSEMHTGGGDCRINFTEKGINIDVVSVDQISFFSGLIKKEFVKNYKAYGEYAIKNTTMFLNILKKMGKNVVIKVGKENTLSIKSNKKEVITKFADKDLVDEVPNMNLKYDYKIKIKTEELKDVMGSASIFGNSDANTINLLVKGKELIITVEDKEDKMIKTIDIDNESTIDIDIKMTTSIITPIVATLTAEYITLYMKTDYPLKMKENIGNYNINKWIVAPRIEDDEKEEQHEDDEENEEED